MYSCAAIKPNASYEWFTFKGKTPVELDFRGKPVSISKGTKFGVRKSTNGKFIRLVLGDDVNRVLTVNLEQAKALAKGVIGNG